MNEVNKHRKLHFYLFLLMINCLVLNSLLFVFAINGVSEESDVEPEFVYDDGGRSDPFIPLLDNFGNRPKLEPVLKQEEFLFQR